MSYTLRPYQQSCVDTVFDYMSQKSGNPIACLPTGTGKSIVIAEMCRTALAMYHDTNIIVATHSKELVSQNYQKLVHIWPEASVGVYSAGLNKRQMGKRITFCGIQSVWQKAFRFNRTDLLIIDECHSLPKKSIGIWHHFIKELRIANPYLRVFGLSATPYRMTQGLLTEGDEKLFDEIAYEYGLIEAIEQGYLTPLYNHRTETHFDVSNVHKRGGEFIESELQKAVNVDSVTQKCVQEIVTQGEDRKSWLVFCSGIDHALAVRDCIRSYGITCETVTGETPRVERDTILNNYKNGLIKCVTNNNVLTTGFDHPELDMIACMRPTGSPGLWVQMLGRGMRLSAGKVNCKILDFADNTNRHGPIDKIRPKDKTSSGYGTAPSKLCPDCMSVVPASSMVCKECGYQFPIDRTPDISAKASGGALLSNQIDIRKLPVKQVFYHPHFKEGKAPSMKVTYLVGEVKPINEWIFPENEKSRGRFVKWWMKRSPQVPPMNVDGCLQLKETLTPPAFISVRKNGKWDEIVSHEFA